MTAYLTTQLLASAAGFGLGSCFGFAWARSYCRQNHHTTKHHDTAGE